MEREQEKNNRLCKSLAEVTNSIMIQLEHFNIQTMAEEIRRLKYELRMYKDDLATAK